MLSRRSFVAASLAFALPARAQAAWPAKPIKLVVPYAPGGSTDVIGRVIAEYLGQRLGQNIVVENRPGKGATIGSSQVARATPDGYTLVATGSGPAAINKALYKDLGYETEKDFEPISLVAVFPIVIVASSKLPVKTLNELVAYALERPNQLNYGSVGIGSSQHLGGVYFEQITGAKLTHVPYRNIAQYTPDLMAGTVPLGFQWLPNVLAALQSGGAKAIAVANDKRMAALPDVPTTAESGVQNYINSGWFVLLAPKGTPKPIVTKLNEEFTAALKDPALREKFTEQGAEPVVMSPEELAKFMSAEAVKWRDIITKAGIQPIQ